MSATPPSPRIDGGRRRRIVAIGIAIIIVTVIVGLSLAWLFFFGEEAPPAPTLDDALQLLQSPSPTE